MRQEKRDRLEKEKLKDRNRERESRKNGKAKGIIGKRKYKN